MSTNQLAQLDATEQAALIRAGEASPTELVDDAITRIEKLNPDLNAVVFERFERARAEAGAGLPDGPFRGVPFLLKDLACPMAGELQADGMQAAKDAAVVGPVDSNLVRRYREAGLVVLGRTNSPEFGLVPTTEPKAFGATHNPWNLAHTPGGSSGGSAAAVAAGLVPVAHASDGGGSIRIPASCCGLVGLKPSRGRISIGPTAGELSRFLSVQFAVTRSVRDAALMLDIAAGAEPGDPVAAPPPAEPYCTSFEVEPPRLRIGLMTTFPGGEQAAAADCVDVTIASARALEGLGHRVESAYPAALDSPARIEHFSTIWCANTAFAVLGWSRTLGRELGEGDLEPLTIALAKRGDVPAAEFLAAVNGMQLWSREVMQWWEDFDLLLTPTVGEEPPRLGEFDDPDNVWHGFVRAATFTPYTPFANQTGQPAISVPTGMSHNGLPLGVQLVGAYGREDLLLQVARQLEQVQPWADRRPSVHA